MNLEKAKLKLERFSDKIDWVWTKKIVFMIFLSFLSAWIFSNIILKAELFPIGLSATSAGISMSLKEGGVITESQRITLVYPLINLFINIPIFIFAWFKLNRKITINSIIVMLSITTFMLIMRYIPLIGTFDFLQQVTDPWTKKIIAGLVGGTALAYVNSKIYHSGGTSAGLDPIAFFFSRKSKGKIGAIVGIFSLINILFFLLVITTLGNSSLSFGDVVQKAWSSSQFIGTIFLVFALSIIINILYSTSEKREVRIITDKYDDIKNILNSSKYFKRGHTVTNVYGGFTGKPRKEIRVLLNELESLLLFDLVKKIDPNALVTKVKIFDKVLGKFGFGTDENIYNEKIEQLRRTEHKKKKELHKQKIHNKNVKDTKKSESNIKKVDKEKSKKTPSKEDKK